MSELVMAVPGSFGALHKSSDDRCTTTPGVTEMTKKATETLVFPARPAIALCKTTRKSI